MRLPNFLDSLTLLYCHMLYQSELLEMMGKMLFMH